MLEAILFDLDGTLWDSSKEVLIAWNTVIEKHPQAKRGPLTAEELNGCFGLPMSEIAVKLFPLCDEKEQEELMRACEVEEQHYLEQHGAVLFPNLEETLAKLKETYKLFIVSNCQSGYIETFLKAHKLGQYFEDTQCWGDHRVSKGENNLYLMERNHIKHAIYVGDTVGDEASARVANIPFVFAKYGFGEATNPDYVIEQIADLPTLLEKLL